MSWFGHNIHECLLLLYTGPLSCTVYSIRLSCTHTDTQTHTNSIHMWQCQRKETIYITPRYGWMSAVVVYGELSVNWMKDHGNYSHAVIDYIIISIIVELHSIIPLFNPICIYICVRSIRKQLLTGRRQNVFIRIIICRWHSEQQTQMEFVFSISIRNKESMMHPIFPSEAIMWSHYWYRSI